MSSKSWLQVARRRWPRAEWVSGRGRFAVLAHCRVLTVTLHVDRAQAERAKDFIDSCGCGGGCTRLHEIVELAP